MSDNPNEPVADAAGAHHHGQDGGRETLTAGEAQREDAARGASTQDQPAMAQNNATDDEKIEGIVAQSRVDVGHESHERVQEVLRQRFADAGVEVEPERLSDLAAAVGDAQA